MHRLLLADDEVVITLQQLEEILASLGYDVVGTASTGPDAVKMAGDLMPDLVLMDIAMPGKSDGIGAADTIREQLGIPIVFLTAYADAPLIRSSEVVPFGYVFKPFRKWQIRAALEIALHRKNLEQQIQDASNDVESQVTIRTNALSSMNKKLRAQIAGKDDLLRSLRRREKELEERAINFEEMNSATEILLSKKDKDREDLEDKLMLNIRELVMPYIERLKASDVTEQQRIYVDIIESNIKNATMPIVSGTSDVFLKLTPTEIKVANLLKQGKMTKDIALLMGLSARTIESYRSSIRRKFGIKQRNINLRTFLMSKH